MGDESWRYTIVQMPPKKYLRDPGNYRPVAILDIFYKKFSKLLYKRLMPILNREQSDEQVAFRPNYWLEDALSVFEGLVGNAMKFNLEVWLCSIDLRKAFDRIEYGALFKALESHGIPSSYLNLLKALYSSQVASVQGSKYFEISRGVKQGDIISPMLFHCALDVAMTKWKQKLSTHGWKIDEQYLRLAKMRYADDIILYAKSKDELRSMLELFVTELCHIDLA